jgi:hypothetical protein
VTPGRPDHRPWLEGRGGGFSIGLRPLGNDAWFEGGEAADAIVARKSALLESSREQVWAEAPGSVAAQREAADLVAEAIGRPITGEPPLLAAALAVSDDLCLMERRPGAWTLTALSLSAGTFFTAQQAIGKSLAELHGPVPGFGDALLGRVQRIFDNLPEKTVLERRNWTVVDDDALHRPTSKGVASLGMNAPEDIPLFVRVERQTLRRLPITGGLLFTIRVRTRALEDLGSGDGLEGFARAWRGAGPDYRAYKGLARFDGPVERLLARAGVLAGGE